MSVCGSISLNAEQGAGNLASVLSETYGEDGIAMIVDEGSMTGFIQPN